MVVWLALFLMASNSDCKDVVSLAYSLDMEVIHPEHMEQIKSNCCNAKGIICKTLKTEDREETYVSVIAWHNLGLTGTLSKLPQKLVELYVQGNEIRGNMPSIPKTLKILFIGSIDGPGNQIRGTIDILTPYQLSINDNLITDVIIHHSLSLSYCDLSNNPLLNNPHVQYLTKCTRDMLYVPGMSTSSIVAIVSVSIIILSSLAAFCFLKRRRNVLQMQGTDSEPLLTE